MFVLLTVSVLVSASILFNQPTRTRAQDDAVVAQVDDAEFAVAPGDTIVQGTLVVDGDTKTCIIPEVTISASGDDGSTPNAVVETELTQDCREVVTAIGYFGGPFEANGEGQPGGRWGETTAETSQVSGMKRALLRAAVIRYRSGGWHDHKDVLGIVLTESYADMSYYDNGSSVYGGHNPLTFCWNALDGWYGNWSAWNWGPNGPSSVWIWKMCNFSWIGGTYTDTLLVEVYSWPGNRYGVYCSHWGSFVPGAKFSCSSRHWAA